MELSGLGGMTPNTVVMPFYIDKEDEGAEVCILYRFILPSHSVSA